MVVVCRLTAPYCSNWSESRDKKDRQGLAKGLGLFSFTRLGYCFLSADRLLQFSLSFSQEILIGCLIMDTV